jgi:putative addiction module component (TIGR02574 family)
VAAPTIEELLALPVETRLAIVEALEESLLAEHQPITDEERAILDEALRESLAHPEDAIPWEVVRAELLREP